MKVFCAAFMCSQFGFVIFWQKDLGAKAAHKMLVQLTPGRSRGRSRAAGWSQRWPRTCQRRAGTGSRRRPEASSGWRARDKFRLCRF
jgi:hypothetical protein